MCLAKLRVDSVVPRVADYHQRRRNSSDNFTLESYAALRDLDGEDSL